jgi:TetR/AcrR family transcriptional regulator, transcriptional repressor for nem operon
MKRTREGRTRINDPAAMRRRVIDAAATAFQSHGYHATSTHDIMRAAGVSAGALHHHFPTKKSIGLAVIHERVALAIEETWIAPIRSAPTTMEGVSIVFRRIAAALDDRGKVLGCPLNNLALEIALADTELRNAIKEVFRRWHAAISEKLRADLESGVVQDVVPEDLATLIVSSYSGAIALAKAEQSSQPLKRCAMQLAALLQTNRRQPERTRRRPRSVQHA